MLPRNLKYESKIESALARSFRSNIAPQNGTGNYNLGDTIIVNVPTRNNLVLVSSESYLKFNVTLTSAAAANSFRWDSCGAHGLIQRIKIYHGSNLIEDCDSYGMLAKILMDTQTSTDATYGKLNVISGTRSDTVLVLPTIATADAAGADLPSATLLVNALKTSQNASNILSVNQINSGERINASNALVANNGTVTATYCINLVSILGSLSANNYLPLFAMTSSPLRCEITLVSNLNFGMSCLTGANANTAVVTNCEYVANFIELSDTAVGMIYDSLQGQPLQFVVPSYRNYQFSNNLAAATTQISMPIAAKFSSLKALMVAIRDQGTGAVTYFPYSSVTRGITDYTFRVGAQIMPSKAPSTTQEMFCELIKAVSSIADLNNQPSIDKYSYNLAASVANVETITATSNLNSGSFYIGLDLENYCNSDKTQLFAGYNSNTDDIFAIMNFAPQGTAITVRFDAFANFDAVFICENNTAYVKF